MSARCKCGATWGGGSQAHCSACHVTFSAVGPFDAHRAGPKGARNPDARVCAEPTSLGFVQRENGVWGAPGDPTRVFPQKAAS